MTHRLTRRMLLATGALAALVGAAFVVMVVAVREQRDSARLALRAESAIAAGSDLERTLLNMENGARAFVASGRERLLDPWRQARAGYPAEVQRLEALVADTPAQLAQARQLSAAIDDYVNLWSIPLIELAREQPDVARSVIVNDTGRRRVDDVRQRFARLAATERAVAQAREQRAEDRSNLALWLGVGGLALVVGLALALASYLGRSIVGPVRRVAAAAERLAGGDLEVRVPEDRDDELGHLARSFNTMADSLRRSHGVVQARTAELERSNRELAQYASVTSHDLREPLLSVSRFADLLAARYHGRLDAQGDEMIDCIRAGTERMRVLVRDLLQYAQVGRGALQLRAVACDELVERARQDLDALIAERDAELRADPLPIVHGDANLLAQVFQNLISNALKFAGDEPPRVHVTAQSVERSWRIAVSDNGVGIDPADAARIFEPFERLSAGGGRTGTGIGLAICQKVVELHGGRIWVEGRDGRGSTFVFTLPAEPGAPLPPAIDRSSGSARTSGAPTPALRSELEQPARSGDPALLVER